MFVFPKKINRIFKKDLHQKQLDDNGFVIVPFYSNNDINNLTNFYNETSIANQIGFRPTTYFQSNDYRIKASEFIKNTAQPYLENYLENYKTYMGSFIVKHADKNSELGVHQDMTLVDESKFMGINIWSPLCDTTPENGALYLIPKSHRIFPTYRNATIKNMYDNYYDIIKAYMQPIYMKAGEAIIFDNSLLHFSPINKSNEIRIATNVFITHKDATITICYNDTERNKIELFEQNDDFFTTYQQFDNSNNKLRPKIGNSIGYRDYDFPILTPKILEQLYGKLPNKNLFQKIRQILFS